MPAIAIRLENMIRGAHLISLCASSEISQALFKFAGDEFEDAKYGFRLVIPEYARDKATVIAGRGVPISVTRACTNIQLSAMV
jgi:hypothetical protein